MGIGRSNTPKSFINACEVLVYTENLLPGDEGEAPSREPDPSEWIGIGLRATEETGQEDGWAHLSAVGNKMRLLDPAFDPRTYGHRRLSSLIRSQPESFEVTEVPTAGGASQVIVRVRQ